ncbi:hypothetical protein CHS0354_035844 [Potamilus streckersoni]|uniref:Uncharacterized protein n=1 Tax=Potamilus streckersoni TaxID=2493646 RepID=A0AAE0SXW4_9BIVA|nr:hypothetical protein CHS0354_035844 [Potamilus streckersoni]
MGVLPQSPTRLPPIKRRIGSPITYPKFFDIQRNKSLNLTYNKHFPPCSWYNGTESNPMQGTAGKKPHLLSHKTPTPQEKHSVTQNTNTPNKGAVQDSRPAATPIWTSMEQPQGNRGLTPEHRLRNR